MRTYINYILAITLSLLVFSCDLKVQKPFDFVPDTKEIATYEDQTVWEWLQTQKSPAGAAVLDQFKFDYLIEAIQYTGLVDEFNRRSDRRTFLLLNNNGFAGTGKIFQALSNKITGPVSGLDKARLTNVLKYHIINQYITQVDPLKVYGTDYFFQTLNDGDAGKILLRRDERYNVSINPATVSPLTAARRGTSVRTHNLRYANGIAHVLNDYTRNVAF